MSCRACASDDALETCAFCGHPHCASHRAERDGFVACVPCLEAEHTRRQAAAQRASTSTQSTPTPTTSPEPAPPPLIEPPGNAKPLLAASIASAVMAGYLWGLMGRVLTDLAWPAWTRPVVVAAGAAFVLGATFVIVKTRSWPKPEGPHVP